jgi:sugar (pentulose or hexulose) kinase
VRFLAVDFGTTSTKSALVDLTTGVFSHLRRLPALPTVAPVGGHHEVSLEAIRQRFDTICANAWKAAPFDGIVLCSEMHGFAILHASTGTPLTQYVSWLDARSLEVLDGESTVGAVAQRLGDAAFRKITGMRPRPGFPLLNLIHCARTLDLPEEIVIVSLPGWLATQCAFPAQGTTPAQGVFPAPEHPTILAGMALFDVVAGENSEVMLDVVRDLGKVDVRIGDPAVDDTLAGYWYSPDDPVPIYAGVGDHQCSVLGAGVSAPGVASVNLGTGSQVGLVDGPLDNEVVEHRPFFDGRHLSAVTHIPAGRALDEFVGFLQQAAAFGRDADDVAPDMWQALARITLEDVSKAGLDVDLAVFDGARGWSGGGRITRIVEGRLTPLNYLASMLDAFGRQYGQVLDQLDPDRSIKRVALSGGIARNLPHLATIVAAGSGRQVDGAVELDESLLGLRALALRCAGRVNTVAAGQTRFGRQSQLEESI